MVKDFHAGSICDPPEVAGLRGFLTAKENVPHLKSHLSGVRHPVPLIFRAEPPFHAIGEQQLFDGL
jgi:hypothetical protein